MLHLSSFRSVLSFGLAAFIALAFVIAGSGIAAAQSKNDDEQTTDSPKVKAGGFQFADLVGKKVDMLTKKNYYRDAEVEEVEPGKLDNSVKHFILTNGKKSVRVVASKIVEMHRDGKNLDVAYDKKNRCLIHDLDKRARRLVYEKETNSRLRPLRARLWKHLTVEEENRFLERQAAVHKRREREVSSNSFP